MSERRRGRCSSCRIADRLRGLRSSTASYFSGYGTPRGSVVHVDTMEEMQPHPFYRRVRRITRRFEATVGNTDFEEGPTQLVRGAFTATIRDPKDL